MTILERVFKVTEKSRDTYVVSGRLCGIVDRIYTFPEQALPLAVIETLKIRVLALLSLAANETFRLHPTCILASPPLSYGKRRLRSAECGVEYVRRLKRRARTGDLWYLDEMRVCVNGEVYYLERVINQEDDRIHILVRKRGDIVAAKRFSRKLSERGELPRELVAGKLGGYGVACRRFVPRVPRVTRKWPNNRANVSHELGRRRKSLLRRLKSTGRDQFFVGVDSAVADLFGVARQTTSASNFQILRSRALVDWRDVSAAC